MARANPYKHIGGGCFVSRGEVGPCDDDFEDTETGEVWNVETTPDEHFSMPSRYGGVIDRLPVGARRIPGYNPGMLPDTPYPVPQRNPTPMFYAGVVAGAALIVGGAVWYRHRSARETQLQTPEQRPTGPHVSGPLRRDPPPAAEIRVGDQNEHLVVRRVDAHRGFAYGIAEVTSAEIGWNLQPGMFVWLVQVNQDNEPAESEEAQYRTEGGAVAGATSWIDANYDELVRLAQG